MVTYGATDLSKMYNCTRPTIYNKFKDERLTEYVITENGKKRFKGEGLQLLGHILAENKPEVKEETATDTDNLQANFTKEYIESLKEQVQKLEKEKETIQVRYDDLLSKYHEKDKLLTGEVTKENEFQNKYEDLLNKYHEKDKLLTSAITEKQKGFFAKLFSK